MRAAGSTRSVALASIVAVAVLAGCGQEPGGVEGAAAADQTLAELQTQISGTGAEQSAGEYLANYALDAPVKRCMSAADMPFQISYVDGSVGRENMSVGGTWAVPLMDDTVLRNLQVWAEKVPQARKAEAAPPQGAVENTAEFTQALNRCSEQEGQAAAEPEASRRLAFELFSLVHRVEDEVGDVALYDSCMSAAGFDVAGDGYDGVTGLYRLLQDKAPAWAQIPEVGADGGAAWDAYHAWALSALRADSDCRSEKHAQVMAELAPLLADFENDNADAIAAVRADWAGLVQQAQSKGWVDDTETYQTTTVR